MDRSLRRKHKRRTCFFTVTYVPRPETEEEEDNLFNDIDHGGNWIAASCDRNMSVLRVVSKGPLRIGHCDCEDVV